MSTLALPPAQPALGSTGAVWRLAFAGALTLLVWALAYQPTLLAMAHVWQTSETYAHGFLIAPIAAALGYRLRHVLSAAPLARAPLALLPLALDGQRLPLRRQPPSIGEHSRQVMLDLGYSHTDIQALVDQGIIRTPEEGT